MGPLQSLAKHPCSSLVVHEHDERPGPSEGAEPFECGLERLLSMFTGKVQGTHILGVYRLSGDEI